METWAKTCGPSPGVVLTHTQIGPKPKKSSTRADSTFFCPQHPSPSGSIRVRASGPRWRPAAAPGAPRRPPAPRRRAAGPAAPAAPPGSPGGSASPWNTLGVALRARGGVLEVDELLHLKKPKPVVGFLRPSTVWRSCTTYARGKMPPYQLLCWWQISFHTDNNHT